MSPIKRDVSGSYANRSPQRTRERANSDAANKHHLNAVAATGAGASKQLQQQQQQQQSARKTPLAHANLSMQQLFRDGPPDGDFAGALEATRYKILDEGIKSDSDGMVSSKQRVKRLCVFGRFASIDIFLFVSNYSLP